MRPLNAYYAGLVKFVAGGKEAFMVKYNSMSQSGKYVAPGIDDPCPTVAVQSRLGVAKACFLAKHFSGSPADRAISIDGPAHAITTVDHHALVSGNFLTAYYGNGYNSPVEAPAPTVTTKDRFQLVQSSIPEYAVRKWMQPRPSSCRPGL